MTIIFLRCSVTWLLLAFLMILICVQSDVHIFPGSFLLSIFPTIIIASPHYVIITSSPPINMNTQISSNSSQACPEGHDPDPTQGHPQAEPDQNKQTMTFQSQASTLNTQHISNQPSRLRGGQNGGVMTVLGWIICLQCCECCCEWPCCWSE